MVLEDIEHWLSSLHHSEQLKVFKLLSEYLSNNELKNVMIELANGRNLFEIHYQMGFIRKYQVDLIRIYKSNGENL